MLPKETLGESYLIGSATTIERLSGDRRLLERVFLTKGEVLSEQPTLQLPIRGEARDSEALRGEIKAGKKMRPFSTCFRLGVLP